MKKILLCLLACCGAGALQTFAVCDTTLTSHFGGEKISGIETFTWNYVEGTPGDCSGNVFQNVYFEKVGGGIVFSNSRTANVGTTTIDTVHISNTDGEGQYDVTFFQSGVGPTGTATPPSIVVTIDNTAPTLSSVSLSPDGGSINTGGSITLDFTADEALENTPTVAMTDSASGSITCGSVSDTSAGARTSWQTTCTVSSSNANGAVSFTINGQDDAGNNLAEVSSTTDGSSVEVLIYGGGGGGAASSESVEQTESIETHDPTIVQVVHEVIENIYHSEHQNEEDDSDSAITEEIIEQLYELSSETFNGFVQYLSDRNIINESSDCEVARCEETITNKEIASIGVLIGNYELLTPEQYTPSYVDLDYLDPSNWIPTIAETAKKSGIVSSDLETFAPHAQTSRERTYTMLMSSACIDIPEGQDVYSVVKEHGFTLRDKDTFEGDRDILRQEVFTIATRVLLHIDVHGGCE